MEAPEHHIIGGGIRSLHIHMTPILALSWRTKKTQCCFHASKHGSRAWMQGHWVLMDTIFSSMVPHLLHKATSASHNLLTWWQLLTWCDTARTLLKALAGWFWIRLVKQLPRYGGKRRGKGSKRRDAMISVPLGITKWHHFLGRSICNLLSQHHYTVSALVATISEPSSCILRSYWPNCLMQMNINISIIRLCHCHLYQIPMLPQVCFDSREGFLYRVKIRGVRWEKLIVHSPHDSEQLLQLHVTQLWTLNSGSILRTNSDPTLRLVPKLPIGMTLYHPISDPWIPPLLLVMSSLSHFLFEHCFTLPYLLFPALPSAMPVCSDLLISEFPTSPSEPIRLSLYVHNTFWTWKVLCSLFIQTSNYISRTNSCMLL